MNTLLEKVVYCTILGSLCVSVLSSSAHGQNAEIYIIEAGTDPESAGGGPTFVDITNRLGEQIAFEIFIRHIGPEPLTPIRGIAVDLPCEAVGGCSGSVEYVRGSGGFDRPREDFVFPFFAITDPAVVDESMCPGGTVRFAVVNGFVDRDITGLGPRYVGEFKLSLPANASGAFFVPKIGGSQMVDVNSVPIPVFLRALVLVGSLETIGGAIYTDCDAPLTSGEEGVEVTVSGPNGFFTTITSGPSGTWHIPNVPCGVYTVTPHQVFREYCHVDIGGDCPSEPCETSSRITVDARHRSENLSIQFLGQPACITNDLNYDQICTIVFDADLFVQCVYDGDCVGPEGQDLQCPADCNCDGLATIVFDANCFRHNVYMKGVCGECPDDVPSSASGRLEGRRPASGFTIGGAVYDDDADPLVSGIEGVIVQIIGDGRRIVATATTSGPSGIWRVDDLPAGAYTLVFEQRDGWAAVGRDVIPIVVNAENEAANLSIGMLRSPDRSHRWRDRVR